MRKMQPEYEVPIRHKDPVADNDRNQLNLLDRMYVRHKPTITPVRVNNLRFTEPNLFR